MQFPPEPTTYSTVRHHTGTKTLDSVSTVRLMMCVFDFKWSLIVMVMNSREFSLFSLLLLKAEIASQTLQALRSYLKMPCFRSVILFNKTLPATSFYVHINWEAKCRPG